MTPLVDASPLQLQRAIVDNFCKSWSDVVVPFGHPNPYILFGVQGFISGIPYMMTNSLFDGDPRMTHADVEDIISYYREHSLPMMWFLSPSGQETRLPSILEEIGLELAAMRVPGMVVDLEVSDKDHLQNLAVEGKIARLAPANQDQVKAYNDIFMRAFEVDASLAEAMEKLTTAFLKHPQSSHFFAYQDGVPVATASVIYEAGVAGIYNVATLPNYQRQGLATSLMATLMLESLQRGYQYSILQSSERGKVVYERLGYEVSFWFKRYLLRPGQVGL